MVRRHEGDRGSGLGRGVAGRLRRQPLPLDFNCPQSAPTDSLQVARAAMPMARMPRAVTAVMQATEVTAATPTGPGLRAGECGKAVRRRNANWAVACIPTHLPPTLSHWINSPCFPLLRNGGSGGNGEAKAGSGLLHLLPAAGTRL